MGAYGGGQAPSPLFVGSFDHRITLYAQQVKALNLVADLVNCRKLPTKGDVAIVGGGVAGLTIAAALAKVGHAELKINLYEKAPNLLHLQRECETRYLHPHLYDWPEADATHDDAGLPILNWKAGTAKSVADTIEREFNKLINGRVNVCKNSEVTEVDTVGGGFQFKIKGKPPRSADILFACPGFSYEITTSDRSPSYWSNASFYDPADLKKEEVRYFISGNGDGGLVDFSLAAFNNLSHIAIAELAVRLPGIEETAQILKDIETNARTVSDPPLDLYTAYRTRIKIRNEQIDIFNQHLRHKTIMYFHTQNKQLFSLNSSILNRFIVFAASVVLGDRCSLICNQKLMSKLEDDVIRIEGTPDIEPHYRRFRFGVDREQALKPFEKFQPWPNSSSCETPKLKKVAQDIFSGPMQRGLISPKPVAILNGSRSKNLRIDLADPKTKIYKTSAVNLSVHERDFLAEAHRGFQAVGIGNVRILNLIINAIETDRRLFKAGNAPDIWTNPPISNIIKNEPNSIFEVEFPENITRLIFSLEIAHASIVTCLLKLKDVLRPHGIEININCNNLTSYSSMTSITNTNADFVCASYGSYCISKEMSDDIYRIKEFSRSYLAVLPIYQNVTFAMRRRRSADDMRNDITHVRQSYAFKFSTGHLGSINLFGKDAIVNFFGSSQKILEDMENIGKDSLVWIWEPWASILEARGKWLRTGYTNGSWILLFGRSDSWGSPDKVKELYAILTLIVETWRYCARHQDETERLMINSPEIRTTLDLLGMFEKKIDSNEERGGHNSAIRRKAHLKRLRDVA